MDIRHSGARPYLTARQLEVLALLAEGLPNKLICRRLHISTGTVKTHISSILRAMGVSSRLQAVLCARRHGLLSDGAMQPNRTLRARTRPTGATHREVSGRSERISTKRDEEKVML